MFLVFCHHILQAPAFYLLFLSFASFYFLLSLIPVMLVFSARQHAERAICYRKSVCPSVCPSHGWISRKRL